ncbi:MAG: hypothetical protein ABSC30_02970 [Acidimicrobiales bacterium]
MLHVLPPSVVTTTAALVAVGSLPTAQQSAVEAHETPASGPVPVGTVWVLHVLPPSVVTTTAALVPVGSLPTAQQSVVDAHETAASGPVPAGTVCAAHVLPPSVVTTMAPLVSEPSVPTAQHSEETKQDIPVKFASLPAGFWTAQGPVCADAVPLRIREPIAPARQATPRTMQERLTRATVRARPPVRSRQGLAL